MKKKDEIKLICKFMNCDEYVIKNNSLDDLLPIIYKIEKMDFNVNGYTSSLEVMVVNNECDISYEGYYSGSIINIKGKNKIDSVYKAIIKFIKWYYEYGRNITMF